MSTNLELEGTVNSAQESQANYMCRVRQLAGRILGRSAMALTLFASGIAVSAGEITVEDPAPAYATTTFSNDYPDSDARDYDVSTYTWWKDENGNGIADVTPSETDNDESMSSRGYGYRNCTDGVAYWVGKYLTLNVAGWGNAKNWDNAAPQADVISGTTTTNIEPGDIAQSDDGSFGHVGFVTTVTKNVDGTVQSFATAELNKSGIGEYSTNTYSARNAANKFSRGGSNQWDHFIDLNGSGKGLNNEDLNNSSSGSTGSKPAPILFNNTLNIFTRGGDGQIYTQYWTGTQWTGYSSLGGNMISNPAVIVNGNALNIFAIGQDGRVYTQFFNGTGWSGWSSLGSQQMQGDVSVIKYGTELDVFALGTDSHPYKDTWQPASGWGGFSSLGNYMAGTLSPVQYGSELDVISRGGDNQIYKDTWNGIAWSGFTTLGGSLASNPEAVSYAGQLTVWARNAAGDEWKRTWNGSGWDGWTDMGGTFQGDPYVTAYNSDLEVFARAMDGSIYTRFWSASGNSWSGWSYLGGHAASDPTAVQYSTELDVFYQGNDGKTYKDTFQPATGWGGFSALPG